MPHNSQLSRSKSIQNLSSIASLSLLSFLAPACHRYTLNRSPDDRRCRSNTQSYLRRQIDGAEARFFSAIAEASICYKHKKLRHPRTTRRSLVSQNQIATINTSTRRNDVHVRRVVTGNGIGKDRKETDVHDATVNESNHARMVEKAHSRTLQWLQGGSEEQTAVVHSWYPPNFFDDTFERQFAESSRLPPTFFSDINGLRDLIPRPTNDKISSTSNKCKGGSVEDHQNGADPGQSTASHPPGDNGIEQRLKLLNSVRELEETLAAAKSQLKASLTERPSALQSLATSANHHSASPIILSKEHYMNLVDLYYYSHNSRFSPESTDMSPTPEFLDDYSFQLSEDFSKADQDYLNEDEEYELPMKEVHETLKSQKLSEIAAMQVFVDLLLDEQSSTRALFESYNGLPQPGVAFLPSGVLRLFMQRMSTPWTRSEKSMLRYLSLIDDMQKAKIPISRSEWTSAIYLAGRSFARVTESEVASSFKIWQQMEQEAGIQSSHVTFNILFDIAVRAGKFALGESILMEMRKRNLRLNRLGRVSLIYYHGLRGDGDGVRKTYRDFVEAGEIVDTLVLNCVIASLLNAQEPAAAEQVYERMKSMFSRLVKNVKEDGTNAYYLRYPPPGESVIDREMASTHLGRVLLRAPHLQAILPEHHKALQASMPLAPDFTTFRSMLAYHATKTGDLDRLTVLLNEMTDTFGMPLRTLVFQLLFKGFALHGPTGGPDGPWSVKRLELCWKAFRQAVKDERGDNNKRGDLNEPKPLPTLPSITQINAISPNDPIPAFNPPLHNPPMKRLSGWNEFVLDLVIFPAERLRRIERFHAQMFDDENMPKPHEKRQPHTYASPFFQSTIYQAPEPDLDHEEGEYVLPGPTEAAILHANRAVHHDTFNDSLSHESSAEVDHLNMHQESPNKKLNDRHHQKNTQDEHEPQSQSRSSSHSHPHSQSQTTTTTTTNTNINTLVAPTRPLICWLLRAYSRNTKSRARVEEIWGSIRKIWQPRDALERESVVRVLRRCLRDCDREEGRLR